MIRLTGKDWSEIYYALESKALALRQGEYGLEDKPGQDVEWIRHIETIKRLIGPDGTTAAQEGVRGSD
jgi:hypothetical protein